MKILILVMSCKKPPYDALYEAQLRTWDSVKVDGVTTGYYWCDEIETMPWHLHAMLDMIYDMEWDFIFRTNSSSYIDKKALLKFSEKLPLEKCYCGVDGEGFASGSGFWLSRDCVDILRREIKDTPMKVIEDVLIGEIFARNGIPLNPTATRYDYWLKKFFKDLYKMDTTDELRNAYHVRCKSDTEDRGRDLIAFDDVHKIKTELA